MLSGVQASPVGGVPAARSLDFRECVDVVQKLPGGAGPAWAPGDGPGPEPLGSARPQSLVRGKPLSGARPATSVAVGREGP